MYTGGFEMAEKEQQFIRFQLSDDDTVKLEMDQATFIVVSDILGDGLLQRPLNRQGENQLILAWAEFIQRLRAVQEVNEFIRRIMN
jgi:hypothetical protein